jgi:uncharacterized protein (TIGR02996 family)
MTDVDFRDAIADNPDDDLLRFAYADWLEEQGDRDRAEFIRLRVELSRQQTKDAEKRHRAESLLEAHRLRWLGALIDAAPENEWGFYRGLPEELSIQGRELTLDELSRLVGSPHLTRLTYLHLEGMEIGPNGAVALALSPHLKRLAKLLIYGTGIGDRGPSRCRNHRTSLA